MMWQFTGRTRPSFAITPGDDQESIWDYPRPPICVEDSREVIVSFGDMVVAKSNSAYRILETASPPTFYIPPADVNLDLLAQSSGSSFCEWKGAATYWSLPDAGNAGTNVGWSYQSPTSNFEVIKDYLSFYPAKLQCTVAGEIVRPQPGGFYGGWVTNEIIGPYKGEPGTAGW
jgi:uncharacterized protein (DUF427 family)